MTTVELDLDNATFEDVEKAGTPERTRKTRSDKGQPRGRAASTKSLEEDLLVPYGMLAAGLAVPAPTLAGFLMARGEKTVKALLTIAKDHPKMLAALKKGSKMGPATELATTMVGAAVAAALDFGRLPPEHPLAMSMGVTHIYMQMHPPQDNNGHPWNEEFAEVPG